MTDSTDEVSKKFCVGVVVGRRRDDDELGAGVGVGRVERRAQVELVRREVVLELGVDDRRTPVVDQLDPVGVDVERDDLVVRGEQDGVGQPDVPEPGDERSSRSPR